jgi:hypothetical protein
MRKIALPILGTMLGLIVASTSAHAQASRTWVSGVGDDANPCSRTAPCKTFAGAISKTATNGEINCIDPGGFGAVTITKSITIDCDGTFGSILAASTNGVNVNGAGIVVNLRNISIDGFVSGLIGINFINGNSLNVHNVNIFGFNAGTRTGIRFAPSAVNSILQVTDSTITSNGTAPNTGGGIVIQPAVGGSALFVINNSRIMNNSNGIAALSASGGIAGTIRDSTLADNRGNGLTTTATSAINIMVDRATISNNFQAGISSGNANSTIRIGNSAISGNTTGVASVGGGILRSYKNNFINGNGSDGTPITQENLN